MFVNTPIGGFGDAHSGLHGTAMEDVTRDALVRVAVFTTETLAGSTILAKQGETKSEQVQHTR